MWIILALSIVKAAFLAAYGWVRIERTFSIGAKIRCCSSLFSMWLLDIIRGTILFLTVAAVLFGVSLNGWTTLPQEFLRRLFCRGAVFALAEGISYFTYRCAVGSLKNWETSPDISFGVCCGLEMLSIAALYAIPQI